MTNYSQKKLRYRPGHRALRSIRRYQARPASTNPVIPKLAFQRLVKQMVFELFGGDLTMQSTAILALHEASESFLVELFQESNVIALLSERDHITARDLLMARRIRGERM
jgi:histone H3/H4